MARKQKAWEVCQWQASLNTEWLTVIANGTTNEISLVTPAAIEATDSEEFTTLRLIGQIYLRASTPAGAAAATFVPTKLRITVGMVADGILLAGNPWTLVDAGDLFLWEDCFAASPGASTALGQTNALANQLGANDWARHKIDIRVSRKLRPPETLVLSACTAPDHPNPTDLVNIGGWIRTFRAV